MKEIGGFLELELINRGEYHSRAVRLNSGRNALRYFLIYAKPSKIYLPHYICDSVIETVKKEHIAINYYHINEKFEPILDDRNRVEPDSLLLCVNYFGINGSVIQKLSRQYDNLLIDNAQAFFAKPIKGISTFYSPRKFFGVSDGAYLYTDLRTREQPESDISYDRCLHLLKRMDVNATAAFDLYRKNEDGIRFLPVKGMSKLTRAILTSVDYVRVKAAREQNFLFLHEALKNYNELSIRLEEVHGPLIYPLLIARHGVKDILIQNKIYVATYWNEVSSRVGSDTLEYRLSKFLVPLPIDQRYDRQDMQIIVDKLSDFI